MEKNKSSFEKAIESVLEKGPMKSYIKNGIKTKEDTDVILSQIKKFTFKNKAGGKIKNITTGEVEGMPYVKISCSEKTRGELNSWMKDSEIKCIFK